LLSKRRVGLSLLVALEIFLIIFLLYFEILQSIILFVCNFGCINRVSLGISSVVRRSLTESAEPVFFKVGKKFLFFFSNIDIGIFQTIYFDINVGDFSELLFELG